MISALGNANINVGGRTINFGQQSVNIRGVGLMDSGGAADLTQGYKVDDIENVVLAQSNGVPVFVKDVAKVSVGYVPRLGKAGRDHEDDVVAAIVIMNRTLHTNDVVARVRAEIEKINSDGSLPPGVKLVPFYDRTTLVAVTTSTVLHNLIFGCLLIFFIQWIFLGDLRSAIIVGANIPFALFFSIIILVLRGEDANLLSVGAVDFGIIVDAAVILVENVYRNFQARPEERQALLEQLAEQKVGCRSDACDGARRHRSLDRPAAAHPDQRAASRPGDLLLHRDHRGGLHSAVHHAGRRGPDLRPDGANLRLRAGRRADRDLHRDAVPGVAVAAGARQRKSKPIVVRAMRSVYTPVLRWSLTQRKDHDCDRIGLPRCSASSLGSRLGSEFLPTLEEGNLWIRATMPPTISLEAGMPIVNKMRGNSASPSRSHHRGLAARPARQRQRRGGFFNAEFFVPLKPFDEWPAGMTKEKLIDELQAEFAKEFVGIDFNFSQYIQDNVEEGLSGVKGANSVKIIGPDLATLEQIARAAMREMAQVPGITDLGAFWVLGQPNLNIKIDRAKAARYGLNVNDVNTVVQAALGGTTATTLLEADRQFGVVVRLAPEYRNNIDEVRNLKVGVQTASRQRLHSAERTRLDHARYRRVLHLSRAQPALRADQIQRARPRPRRRRGRGAGADRPQREAADRLSHRVGRRVRVAAASQEAACRSFCRSPSLFILVLLYGLFNSFRDSLLALLGLPFAICGGVLGLYVSGLDFSISAAIGFISLFGVSVMSGILIINGYYRVTASGMAPGEAMFHAVQEQMRPILMMTLSACIGLLPAAISTGIGSQVQRPLATVIVGGMLIGPIMLLVVVPALQTIFLGRQAQATSQAAPDAAPAGE